MARQPPTPPPRDVGKVAAFSAGQHRIAAEQVNRTSACARDALFAKHKAGNTWTWYGGLAHWVGVAVTAALTLIAGWYGLNPPGPGAQPAGPSVPANAAVNNLPAPVLAPAPAAVGAAGRFGFIGLLAAAATVCSFVGGELSRAAQGRYAESKQIQAAIDTAAAAIDKAASATDEQRVLDELHKHCL